MTVPRQHDVGRGGLPCGDLLYELEEGPHLSPFLVDRLSRLGWRTNCRPCDENQGAGDEEFGTLRETSTRVHESLTKCAEGMLLPRRPRVSYRLTISPAQRRATAGR